MKRTQEDQVLDHLRTIGPITADIAQRVYCIRQLPTRIWRLKKRGVSIETVMRGGLNSHGERVRYAEHRLAS